MSKDLGRLTQLPFNTERSSIRLAMQDGFSVVGRSSGKTSELRELERLGSRHYHCLWEKPQ
jgi:hypothetical protein